MIREYGRRLLWLLGGLAVSSVGITMMLQANIGLEPWSVLQQGLAQTFGITYGTAAVIVGAVIIVIAIACEESFGIGTLGNIFICGPLIDLLLYLTGRYIQHTASPIVHCHFQHFLHPDYIRQEHLHRRFPKSLRMSVTRRMYNIVKCLIKIRFCHIHLNEMQIIGLSSAKQIGRAHV